MAVYWGSTFIAVTSNSNSFVLQGDYIPAPTQTPGGVTQDLMLHVDDQYLNYPRFDTEKEAVHAVKRHILSATEQSILELVSAIEIARFSIDRLKLEKPLTADANEKIRLDRQSISSWSEELKGLRKLRRAPVDVTWQGRLTRERTDAA
tara:strand:+ start:430 stop:876 length:447 start_codon:yes stop_codon:yes gene_type:complete